MKRIVALAAAATVGAALVLPSAALGASPTRHQAVAVAPPRVVTSFPAGHAFGSFAESLAVARDGSLYASVTIWQADTSNIGRLYRITPDGRMRQVGPDLPVGILSGLAFGPDGYLYAGEIAFAPSDEPAGVLRFGLDGSVSRAVTLPFGTFPNGLAFHGGALYISDSTSGAIWKAVPRAGRAESLDTPWLQDPSLGVVTETGWEGVNGIAFRGNALYAVNADAGTVVRIPIARSGMPGTPATFVQPDTDLRGADGVAFDQDGGLWIAINHADDPEGASRPVGALVRVDRLGHPTVIANNPGWLEYPTQPAFGYSGSARSTLYVLNGALNPLSFEPGVPSLVALKVDVRGVPLP